jgi:predicted AAA+ superfamily ATPase
MATSVDRHELSATLDTALRRSPAVALVRPRQVGKTTLARQFLSPESPNYFDLEDPVALERLAEPMAALSPLRGLIVVDEVQRHPELFSALRVLIDREPRVARFLILGSASPALLKQSSESLAGRLEIIHTPGFALREVGTAQLERLWDRGGISAFIFLQTATPTVWRGATPFCA